jgi:hypothetical protein
MLQMPRVVADSQVPEVCPLKHIWARGWWLRPVILPTPEVIKRISIQGQLEQNESKTLSQKYPTQKKG